MDPVIVAIEEHLDEPTAKGLARAITRLLPDEVLRPGDRLPPIRTLANELCLSATTVNLAWSLLAQWGTITTDGRRGTRIAAGPAVGSPRYQRALHGGHGLPVDLANSVPDPALLPPLDRALSGLTSTSIPGGYLANPVLPELVELLEADWPYRPEAFTVADGAMDAVELVLRTTVRHGERVVIEDPTFPPVSDLLESLGAEIVSVPVDAEGPVPTALEEALATPTVLVFLQPRGQNPTGVSLTRRRVRELAPILERSGATVLEDDATGAVSSTPPISVGSMVPRQTIHARSYSKSHGSDLRLAAVSGPREVIERIEAQRQFGQGWTSGILQRILANFLADPAARQCIDRAREEYAARLGAVRTALSGVGIDVIGDDGLSLWVPVADETTTVMRLAGRGIAVAPGAPFTRLAGPPHVRVCVGMLREDVTEIAELIARAALRHGWSAPSP